MSVSYRTLGAVLLRFIFGLFCNAGSVRFQVDWFAHAEGKRGPSQMVFTHRVIWLRIFGAADASSIEVKSMQT
jgi:hypothetical protein